MGRMAGIWDPLTRYHCIWMVLSRTTTNNDIDGHSTSSQVSIGDSGHIGTTYGGAVNFHWRSDMGLG